MKTTIIAPAVLALAFGSSSAHALTDGEFQTAASKVFLPIIEEYRIPGLAVGLTLDGREFYFNHGEAIRENGKPVANDTIFELGSVSKLFNVTLAELAEERGLLSLKDNVSDYVPALKGTAFDGITLLNLATHTTAGLPLQVPDSVSDSGNGLITYLRTFEPEGDPNATRSYSNVSIGLLGKIAAESFGKPYGEAVEEQVFDGLGLTSTYVSVPSQAADRYAYGYSRDGDQPIRVNPGILDAEAYGVKSTVTDMTRFLGAHLGTVDVPNDISAALSGTRTGYFQTAYYVQDLIWEQYPWPVEVDGLKSGNSSDMALNAQPVERLTSPIPPDFDDVFLNKTGSTNGFGAYVALLPSEKLGVVVLANRNYPNDVRSEATRSLIEMLEPTFSE
ncbi:class C beta-lactamase [Fulvimarina sp. 2208YS6-2-32]|uniref:Beta-lactamase n=1 Tax=Fulvimarina uroteuthidis TaxID=3098149 RepID=A0ABU5I614_9HYPH|nr:class C beta-lactamase [Fulvimarina sp. 2208YS6-2-32]MDY8109596.1 class C beta-lactamase [Fulvimarina sp. 2208YS6-2-32]